MGNPDENIPRRGHLQAKKGSVSVPSDSTRMILLDTKAATQPFKNTMNIWGMA